MSRIQPSRLLPLALTVTLVSIQPLEGQQPQRHWNVQLELGFNGQVGNSSFSILRTGARAKHINPDHAEFEFATLVRYGMSDEKVIANDQKVSTKLDLWPQDTWSPFVFVDASRDVIRKLDFRSNGGAGAKYAFWDGDSGDASLSAAVIWDYQNFRLDPGSDHAETESLARWSVRAKGEKTLSQTTTVEHTTFYQPVLDHGLDYLVTMTTSVSTMVLRDVSLSLEHEFLHDSVPPPGVGPDDQKFSVLLKVTL
jgi:hypothetical protein